MAYATGTAASFAALLAALQGACTGAGWTLSGEVLHKGDVYVRVWASTWVDVATDLGVSGGSYYAGSMEGLHIRGGTGIDGGDALTGASASISRIGRTSLTNSAAGGDALPFTFPVEYFIHIADDPDEVYLVVRSDVDYYQQIAFGHSPLAEATGGTGAWYGASLSPVPNITNSASPYLPGHYCYVEGCASGGSSTLWSAQAIAAPFFAGGDSAGGKFISAILGEVPATAVDVKYRVHHGVDLGGGGWSGYPNAPVYSSVAAYPLLSRSPNALNGAAPLLPILGLVKRASNKHSPVLELGHSRLVRIDHYAAGEEVTYGGDTWVMYPWHRRNLDVPTGSTSGSPITHSGCLGMAIRKVA